MKDFVDILAQPAAVIVFVLAAAGVIFLVKELFKWLQGSVFPTWYKWRLQRKHIVLPFADGCDFVSLKKNRLAS